MSRTLESHLKSDRKGAYIRVTWDASTRREVVERGLRLCLPLLSPSSPTTMAPVSRRYSERSDPDGSFSLDSSGSNSRPPLKNVNINDDVAEKRRRRKSAKIVLAPDPDDEPEAGPSSVGNPGEAEGAAAEGTRGGNLARTKSQLLTVPQAPIINVPMDVMTSNFDQWMKMATDNVGTKLISNRQAEAVDGWRIRVCLLRGYGRYHGEELSLQN